MTEVKVEVKMELVAGQLTKLLARRLTKLLAG